MIPSSMPVLPSAPAGVSSAQGTTTIAKLLPSSRRGFAPGCERRSLAWILLALCPAAWELPCIVLLLLPLGRSISFCMHPRPCAPAGCSTSDSGLIGAKAEPGCDFLLWCRVPGYSEATGRRAPVRSAARPLAAVCTPLQYHSKTARLCIMLKNIVHRASEGGLIKARSATLQRVFVLQNCA